MRLIWATGPLRRTCTKTPHSMSSPYENPSETRHMKRLPEIPAKDLSGLDFQFAHPGGPFHKERRQPWLCFLTLHDVVLYCTTIFYSILFYSRLVLCIVLYSLTDYVCRIILPQRHMVLRTCAINGAEYKQSLQEELLLLACGSGCQDWHSAARVATAFFAGLMVSLSVSSKQEV